MPKAKSKTTPKPIEYCCETFPAGLDLQDIEDHLNALGKEGWELIGVEGGAGQDRVAWFKRSS